MSALSQVARDAGQEVRSVKSAKEKVTAWSSSTSSGVEGDVGGGLWCLLGGIVAAWSLVPHLLQEAASGEE